MNFQWGSDVHEQFYDIYFLMVVDAVTLLFLLDIFVTQVVQTPGALEIWQKGYDLNLKIAIFSKKNQ